MGISNPSLNNGPVKLRLPGERDGDKRPEPGSPEYGIPSSLSSVSGVVGTLRVSL
jgi:hypothetical protein